VASSVAKSPPVTDRNINFLSEYYFLSIILKTLNLSIMYYTLSKSQKKIARIVMDKGLENHYLRSLSEAEAIMKK
jgi:hypothetical protein